MESKTADYTFQFNYPGSKGVYTLESGRVIPYYRLQSYRYASRYCDTNLRIDEFWEHHVRIAVRHGLERDQNRQLQILH